MRPRKKGKAIERKHRFLESARNCDFESIQSEIRKLERCLHPLRAVNFKTSDILRDEDSYADVAHGFWSSLFAYGSSMRWKC